MIITIIITILITGAGVGVKDPTAADPKDP